MWLNVRWLTHAHPPLFVTSALFNKSWTAASFGLQPRGGRTNIRYKAGVGIKTACSPWLFDGGWSAQCGADNWSNEPFIYCTDILTSTKGYLFFYPCRMMHPPRFYCEGSVCCCSALALPVWCFPISWSVGLVAVVPISISFISRRVSETRRTSHSAEKLGNTLLTLHPRYDVVVIFNIFATCRVL